MEARHSEEARNDASVPSSSDNDVDVWKRLWKLPVVPKVRVFWWRVLRGILPDYRTLSRRHIMENSTCALCKAESEDVMHALIECSHAKLFWEAAKELLLIKLPRLHPLTWAKDILCEKAFSQKERAIIISVMYSIWSSRNNLTHGEAGYNPAKSIELVKETLQTLEFPRENPKPIRPVAKWQRPPDGFVKINSDGAFNTSDNLAATGVVAREGLLYRGAMGKTYRGISDPLIIETLALRDAVTYARDRGFSRVVFEVDSENLVHLWHNRATDRSMAKNVLDEISELSVFFTVFSLCHARREANQAAHSCAKFASIQDGLFSWDAEPPAFLVHSLQADCNGV
jgi:ribonuclease HI